MGDKDNKERTMNNKLNFALEITVLCAILIFTVMAYSKAHAQDNSIGNQTVNAEDNSTVNAVKLF